MENKIILTKDAWGQLEWPRDKHFDAICYQVLNHKLTRDEVVALHSEFGCGYAQLYSSGPEQNDYVEDCDCCECCACHECDYEYGCSPYNYIKGIDAE